MSIRTPRLFAVCGALLVFPIAASAAPVDACKNILDQVRNASDRANREMASTQVSLELASKAPDDKRRVALLAQSCAASAEASGILKSYRIVIAECEGGRSSGRSDLLDRVDRSISNIRVALDKACR